MISPFLKYCNVIHNSGKKLKCNKIDKFNLNVCKCILEYCYDRDSRKDEDKLCKKYVLDSSQSPRDTQLACTVYRYIAYIYIYIYIYIYSRKNDLIEHAVKRENLRSEESLRFKRPLT